MVFTEKVCVSVCGCENLGFCVTEFCCWSQAAVCVLSVIFFSWFDDYYLWLPEMNRQCFVRRLMFQISFGNLVKCLFCLWSGSRQPAGCLLCSHWVNRNPEVCVNFAQQREWCVFHGASVCTYISAAAAALGWGGLFLSLFLLHPSVNIFKPWGNSPTLRPCRITHMHTHSFPFPAHTQQRLVWTILGTNSGHSSGTPRSYNTWIMHQQDDFLLSFYLLFIINCMNTLCAAQPPQPHLDFHRTAQSHVSSCTFTDPPEFISSPFLGWTLADFTSLSPGSRGDSLFNKLHLLLSMKRDQMILKAHGISARW